MWKKYWPKIWGNFPLKDVDEAMTLISAIFQTYQDASAPNFSPQKFVESQKLLAGSVKIPGGPAEVVEVPV